MKNRYNQNPETGKETMTTLVKAASYIACIGLLFLVCTACTKCSKPSNKNDDNQVKPPTPEKQIIPADVWKAPDSTALPKDEFRQIWYGRELIAHTANYLGPEGSVSKISNGMNCQNCHVEAGTKFLGNNYSAVFSTYPKFRARSGTKETIVKRISDCFDRSLNGKAPDSTSKEMKAMIAYMKFLGTNVNKGNTPEGAGLEKLAFLDRAADPKKGAVLYQAKCVACHGANGEGILAIDKKSYAFPPLWGAKSYNDAAGLFRVTNFAGYIKNNMPLGATYENPLLTDEESWDIAAFVNSQDRPHMDQSGDWKDISTKPIDFPTGPYSDQFSEKQHKFGPFAPIKAVHKKAKDARKQKNSNLVALTKI